MKRAYDFSKAKRGPLRNLPPMSEVDRHTKVRITIMLDLDLLKFFKSRAASRGAQPYQTQINQALREYVAAHRPNPGGDADHHEAFRVLGHSFGQTRDEGLVNPGGDADHHEAFISRLAERVAEYTVKRSKPRRRATRASRA